MKPIAGLVLGDRYQLVRLIAVGGMGEVWVAEDQALGREVAVKVLREEYAGNEDFLERLRTEARNSAALSHRNIAQMYDYGEQKGSGYLVMELVHGEPMADLLEREPVIPLTRLLPILSQTAFGLHAAHLAGVVHRDVKPGNILLDRSGDVKITDFGVSLAANQVPMTATGMVMGTAQYLSPEQAIGQAATGASDVYALGVVAYEAVAGNRPFTGSTPVDIAVAHVNEEVPPLPQGVDREVADLIYAMLAKDPTERPHPSDALGRAFEDIARRLTRDPWGTPRRPSIARPSRHAQPGNEPHRPGGGAAEPLAPVITPLVIPAAVRRGGRATAPAAPSPAAPSPAAAAAEPRVATSRPPRSRGGTASRRTGRDASASRTTDRPASIAPREAVPGPVPAWQRPEPTEQPTPARGADYRSATTTPPRRDPESFSRADRSQADRSSGSTALPPSRSARRAAELARRSESSGSTPTRGERDQAGPQTPVRTRRDAQAATRRGAASPGPEREGTAPAGSRSAASRSAGSRSTGSRSAASRSAGSRSTGSRSPGGTRSAGESGPAPQLSRRSRSAQPARRRIPRGAMILIAVAVIIIAIVLVIVLPKAAGAAPGHSFATIGAPQMANPQRSWDPGGMMAPDRPRVDALVTSTTKDM